MSKTSTEGTVYMLGIVKQHLENNEKLLAHLQTCTELTVEIPYGKRADRMSHAVVLKATDTRTYEIGGESYTDEATEFVLPDGTKGTKHFEEERKSRIYKTASNIKAMKGDIAFLEKKIAEYKG